MDTPLFGFFITILAFQIGVYINEKTKLAILNPLIIAIVIIIIPLMAFNIDYEIYNRGGSIVGFF